MSKVDEIKEAAIAMADNETVLLKFERLEREQYVTMSYGDISVTVNKKKIISLIEEANEEFKADILALITQV